MAVGSGWAARRLFAANSQGFGEKLDAAQLIQVIKPQIAGFKVPKHLFIVDELPRNVMGKVQKKTLRETYAQVFVQGH